MWSVSRIWKIQLIPIVFLSATSGGIVSVKSDFYKPFHIGEHGELRLWVSHIGNSSLTVHFEFWKDDELRVKCEEVMVFIDSVHRRSTPIPADIRAKLEKFLKEAN